MSEQHGVGVDVGTSNLCVCRQQTDGTFTVRHHRNMLLELESSDDIIDMLERSKYLHIKADNRYYIVGEDALRLANAVGKGDIVRPMRDGLLNPSLQKPQRLLNFILEAVVGKPLTPDEPLRFCVPANPIDKPGVNNLYHQAVLTEFFTSLGYKAKPVNEALANLYHEAPVMDADGVSYPLSGYSISFGAGMSNSCIALNGVSVAEFSITKSGDHIDNQVAEVTGQPVGRIIRVKEKQLDLANPDMTDPIQQALSVYYDEMISRVVRGIKLELAKQTRTFDGALEVVICGGSAMPVGFVPRLEAILAKTELPFTIKGVRLSKEPFYSVSMGCALLARADQHKVKTEK